MPMGGSALDLVGVPLLQETLSAAKQSDAVLLGAIGGHKWNTNEKHMKPETGLVQLRAGPEVKASNCFTTGFVAQCCSLWLVDASTLKKEAAEGVDLMIVRELIGGIYLGSQEVLTLMILVKRLATTQVYASHEVDDIARVTFETAANHTENFVLLTKQMSWRGRPGFFEPIHGSPPNIAGQDKANPFATILSVAMLLNYGLGEENATKRIENAVLGALNKGFRTGDINSARNLIQLHRNWWVARKWVKRY